MDIRVELIGIPFPACDDPTTGKVIVQVKMSGLVAPINTGVLGPICASFHLEFKWLRNHEPHFYFHLPKRLEGAAANLAVNIFEGEYILKHTDLRRMQVGLSLRWYGNCFHCGAEFHGAEDVPDGWTQVNCVGCDRKLGHACTKCSAKAFTPTCDPPCAKCKPLPAPPSAPEGKQGN